LGKDKSLEEAVAQLGGEVLKDSSGYDERTTHMLAAQVNGVLFIFSIVIKVADTVFSWHDPYPVFEKGLDSDPHIIKYIGSELGRN
jgi:hypothetical protein